MAQHLPPRDAVHLLDDLIGLLNHRQLIGAYRDQIC
jgi:hypothetical protein